ncbi:hypothetical protein [Selenomonas sp. AB3002]|uniref:hypothetical protein n=1 Tax=Selenomonas sp. AB3002 TaxID=1392502 RepID=UPI0004968D0D
MTENKMKQVAENLGVKMGREFIFGTDALKFRGKITKRGLVICTKDGQFLSDYWLDSLIKGTRARVYGK